MKADRQNKMLLIALAIVLLLWGKIKQAICSCDSSGLDPGESDFMDDKYEEQPFFTPGSCAEDKKNFGSLKMGFDIEAYERAEDQNILNQPSDYLTRDLDPSRDYLTITKSL